MFNPEKFTQAAETLKTAHQHLCDAQELLALRKEAYETTRASHISAGVAGSNEEIRKANLILLLKPEQADLDAAQKQYREADLQVTLAKISYDVQRYLLRHLETQGGAQ